MLKIAARTFDIYDDLDELVIAKKVAAALGDVAVAEPDEIEQLRDSQFGLLLKTASGGLLRRFPLHTPDAVKLSRAYFAHGDLPAELAEQVGLKIAAAEQQFKIASHGYSDEVAREILDSVAYIDASKVAPAKVAAWKPEDECWGLTIGDRNHFPLHTAELVKVAEAKFATTAAGLEPHERCIYARNIAKQASKLGLKVASASVIHNYTNDGLNASALLSAIDERKRIFKAAGLNTVVLDQLAEAAGCPLVRGELEEDDVFAYRQAKHATAERMDADEIVQVLTGIDKFAGITGRMYLRGLPDPYASCFKRAEAEVATFVDGVDLASIPEDKLREAFDDEFVAEFAKNPVQTYHSLPDPMKAMLRELAGRSNEVPHTGDPTAQLSPTFTNGAPTQRPDQAGQGGGDAQATLSPMYSNAGSGLVY